MAGYTRDWPYTDMHNLNLDWIIETIKEFTETVNTYTERLDQDLVTVEEKIAYIDNFFTNLDVQDEINAKLDSMGRDGELSRLLKPFAEAYMAQDAPGVITAWLTEHMTNPGSVAIDTSLSVAGAAADAKAAGDKIRALETSLDTIERSTLVYHADTYHADNPTYDDIVVQTYYPKVNEKYIYGTAVNITNASEYPAGITQYDANNTVLEHTGKRLIWWQAGTVFALVPGCVKIEVWFNCAYNNNNQFTGINVWASQTERPNIGLPHVYYVEKGGNGNYNKLSDAINQATLYMDSIIHLGPGTWDIIEELGNDYLNGVSDTQRGLYLKNRVHLICDSKSEIVANYTGGASNVNQWLAIFNAGPYGFTLENATLKGSNIRYLIHDERDQDEDPYINSYINCSFEFDNRNNTHWSAKQVIGGGLGKNGYIVIEGCRIKSYQSWDGTISYHNSAAAEARSHIVLHNCYFDLLNTFRLSWYGASELITTADVSGCTLGAAIVERAENSSANIVNTKVYAWNNVIEPK